MSDRTLTDPKVIDGKAFAAKLREKIARQVKQLQSQHGFTPGLAVVLVGEDPASKVYVRNKGEQTKESGMASFEHKLPVTTVAGRAARARSTSSTRTRRSTASSCQLPLPKQIDPQAIINAIDPDKDVDGFHVVNAGRLATGGQGLVPCTPLRLPAAAEGSARRSRRQARGRDRPLQHRRQADGAAAAERELHRHHRAFQDPGPARRSAAAPTS